MTTTSRATRLRIRQLRTERKAWLTAAAAPWGIPWCTGPGSPHHQEPACEGCATVTWCRDRAADVERQLTQLLAPVQAAVQDTLW